MDRGAWRAIVHGVQRIGHSWVSQGYTKTDDKKLLKVKERTLKAGREETKVTWTGNPISLYVDFTPETFRSGENGMIYWKGEKNCHLRIVFSAKLSFKNEEKIKVFPNKQKMNVFITTRLTLQKFLNIFKMEA